MTWRLHYQTISSYRVLPPRWRIVEEEAYKTPPPERYLQQVDELLASTREATRPGDGEDLVSWVFANQAMTHEVSTRQLAGLIEERRALTQRHLEDVRWRLDELVERRPLRRRGPFAVDDGEVNSIEREILNLEKEQRLLELSLWRDTQELRGELVKQRQEAEQTRRRIGYMSGDGDGRP